MAAVPDSTAPLDSTGPSDPPRPPASDPPADPPTDPPADPPADPPTHPPLLRNRDYLGWWIGESVSAFGSTLSLVAYPLLMLLTTGSAARAGIVGAAVSVGALVTMLIGGALADRYSRRLLLMAGPVLEAVAVGTVVVAVLAGHVNVVHIALVGLTQGIISGLTTGASTPALRRIVPATQLPAAFAQMHGRDMAIRLVGPAASGFLFTVARWVPFLGDAISFLAATAGVALVRTPLGPDLDERVPREPILSSIGAGLGFIRRNSYLRFLAAWAAVMNATAAGLFLLIVVLITHRGGGPALVGVTSSAGAAGGLIGAALTTRIARRMQGRSVVIVLGWIRSPRDSSSRPWSRRSPWWRTSHAASTSSTSRSTRSPPRREHPVTMQIHGLTW